MTTILKENIYICVALHYQSVLVLHQYESGIKSAIRHIVIKGNVLKKVYSPIVDVRVANSCNCTHLLLHLDPFNP